MDRRKFLEHTSKAGLGTIVGVGAIGAMQSCGAPLITKRIKFYPGSPGFKQKPLGYAFADLEPAIDAATMALHYNIHAASYTKNMREAISAEKVKLGNMEALMKEISKYSTKLRNNAGGHYNHESFWKWMAPGGQHMSSKIREIIETSFSSLTNLQNTFSDVAMSRFGSGWAWLILTKEKNLMITSTPNQDNPLMDLSEVKGFPLLGIDVWEHAYYLKYQNKRADYINAWWGLINWEEVEARYDYAMTMII